MLKITIGLALTTVSLGALSQPRIYKFEPTKPINQSSIDQWTTDRGLNSNNLVHIMQSSTGYLWICTYDGLLQFDGNSFEIFDKENVPFLKSNAFYRSYEDQSGRIWITSQASGLLLYEKHKFKNIFNNSKLPKSIRCMLLQNQGVHYVGTNNKGLFKLQDSIATQIEHPALMNISVMDIVQDKKSNIWVATNGNGLIRINGDEIAQYKTGDGLLSNVVNTVKTHPDGRILIGTIRGLNILDGKTISSLKISVDNQINSIEVDPFQSIWLATERGLIRINELSGTSEVMSNSQGLPALGLTSFTFDLEGSLWITTNKSGLIRLKDSGIITYHQGHGLSLDLVNIAYEDISNGRIYMGTDGGHVDVFDNGKIFNVKSNNIKQNIGIRDFCVDGTGNLWIASYNGLVKKSNLTEKILDLSTGFPSQDVRRVLEDKQGKLWLATRSGGVIRLVNDKIDKVFNLGFGLQANYALAIEEDRFGAKYIGTNGGGLTIVQPNDSLKTYHLTNDDSGVLIFNIHLDEDGSAWLITSIGIYLFDGKQFRSLPLKTTQKGEVYFDWIEDNLGNIWISSNRGILRIPLTNVREFKRGSDNSIVAKIYGSGDGMRNRECTSTTRMLKASTGEIWVPTLGGFAVVNPKGLNENQFVPPVYITKVTTDDSVYYPSAKINIEPGNLRYTFHFTSLSLSAPDKNKFRYKLNENETWFSTSSRNVTFTNLPPGNYTFYVQGSNNDGIWNDQGAAVSFSIQPFFYQSYAFIISSVLFVALFLFGIYKWRIYDIEKRNRELQKVNSELDKFVYSASHDLRAPLASVLGIVNIARLDKDDENQKNYLTLIEKSIKKLDGFISDIINFSRNARLEVTNSEIDFEKIIQEVFDDLKYLDEHGRISRHVSAVGTGKFYTDPLRVKIILSNLISNSFKYYNAHTKNPFIEVKIKYDSHVALIKVIDNGMGIAEQHLDSIFKMFYRASENSKGSGIGLYIVKETIDKIKGKIEVTSTVGEGTEFEIILPSFKG